MIDIGWLAKNGPCEKFPAGRIIPCQGGADGMERAMYVLLAGRVDMTSAGGKTGPAVPLLPGDVFGGFEFFNDTVKNVYTVAKDSVVYVISESSFTDLSWSQPDILFEVLRAAYAGAASGRRKVQNTEGKNTQTPAVAENDSEFRIPDSGSSNNAGPETPEKPKDNSGPSNKAGPETPEKPKDNSGPSNKAEVVISEDGLFPKGHKRYPGITKPEYSRLAYPKEYTCPFCKKQFMDFKIFSSKLYESAPMRFDLRRYYTGFQPEWYEIITCRHCYFSTVHTYYAESKPVLKKKIESGLAAARESIPMDFDAPRDIDYVFTSHYLALVCSYGYLSQGVPVRAKVWGNLSWLYEDVGDAEMEVFAAEKAAAAYEEVYTGTRLAPVQEQTTCLSIAGMQRRAGIDKDIKKILFQVKTVKMGDKAYVKMAEDFMEDIRKEAQHKE